MTPEMLVMQSLLLQPQLIRQAGGIPQLIANAAAAREAANRTNARAESPTRSPTQSPDRASVKEDEEEEKASVKEEEEEQSSSPTETKDNNEELNSGRKCGFGVSDLL
jgi:hypothetical protein